MSHVKGVGGVFFKSKNKASLLKWYQDVLGFKIEEWGGLSFTPSESVPYTVWSVFADDTEYFAPSSSPFMINFVVDDLVAALSAVREAGGELVGEIQKEEYGDFGWFLDPDGNKIELWQPK